MKRSPLLSLLFAVIFFTGYSQTVNYFEAPTFDNSTSTGRGPNGSSAHAYMRACGLVMANELTSIAPNSTLTSFGFTLNAGATGTAPVGNFTLYLQNSSDMTYNKGTAFSSAITGMTQVYANTMTIPISAGSTSVSVTLSTPFVYTGGSIYVAYDWYCPGPYSSSNAIYRCNSGGLSPGLASNASTTSAPTTLGTTAFRPCFLFGVANTYTNEISVDGVQAPGILSGVSGTSHTVTALIRNNSNITKNNIPVTLNVSGANTFASTQTISTLAAGSTTTVNFTTFAPTLGGLNTLSVSVPADELLTNNSATYSQSITCSEWALNPAGVNYTMGAVGFGSGSGIIACTYTNNFAANLTGLRGGISTNTPSIGNQAWGVLLNSTGSVVATTNTMTITNAMMGTFQTFTFTVPPTLAAGTLYYFGFAQPTHSVTCYPMGTYTTNYVPYLNYVTTTTVGGTPAPLTSNLGYFAMEAIFAPTLAITLNSPTVTCGSTAVLSATTVGSYTWTAGPANSNYSVIPNTNTTYTVNVSDTYGCTNSDSTLVTVDPLTITATSNTTTICAGSTVSISVSGATSYTWSAGPSLNAASFTDTPVSNTSYSVQGSNSVGCTASSSVSILVNALPTLTTSTSAGTVLCVGQTNTLSVTGATTYSWSGGTISSSIVITPTVSGTAIYSVTGTDTNGCEDTAIVSLMINVCAGISEQNGLTGNINVYPNPFNGNLNIVFENEPGRDIEIMVSDIVGNVILRERAVGIKHSVDLSKTESGIYFISVLKNGKPLNCTKVFKE